jgi:hypothetical protein
LLLGAYWLGSRKYSQGRPSPRIKLSYCRSTQWRRWSCPDLKNSELHLLPSRKYSRKYCGIIDQAAQKSPDHQTITPPGLVAMSACDWSDQIACYVFLRFYVSLANELLSKYRGSGRRNILRNQRLGLLWSRRIPRQISTHSSQMKTFGPSMSVRTSCWLLLQNEQCSVGSDIGATPSNICRNRAVFQQPQVSREK